MDPASLYKRVQELKPDFQLLLGYIKKIECLLFWLAFVFFFFSFFFFCF
jgi:hypothetical protein